jgi:diguanylate cyclase (GGDEF)-like protein
VTQRDRQTLRRLVTAAICAGIVAAASTFVLLSDGLVGRGPGPERPSWLLPTLALMVAVASAAVVRVRLRSTVVGASWTDAAILVCIVWLPPAWVPLCVGIGVLAAKLIAGVPRTRAAYNAAKDMLAATGGLTVALALGVAGVGDMTSANVWALLVVGLTVATTENVVGVPILALASGATWHRVLSSNGDIKAAALAGKLAVAVLTLHLLDIDSRLLVVIPPLALCLHLLYSSRVRTRAERAAWQRLAATTEELNSTDLPDVLTVAVVNATKLFGAREAEVFLRDGPDGPLLVRGNVDGVVWSGDPGKAPARFGDGESITASLAGQDLKADLGEVRLHYVGRIALTERERLTLRTFVSALRTAVRNAAAFAEARRLALRNAHAALHDSLTGLANRRQVQEYGATVLGRGRPVALVVLDLDMFREVNETLGHIAGDQLLVEVARRLSRAAGVDDRVARLGGDEFAVVLAGIGTDTAGLAAVEQRARDLLATMDAPIALGGLRVRIEASAGVAFTGAPTVEVPADPKDTENLTAAPEREAAVVELLRQADVAMYKAKRGGPRIVRYEPCLDTADVAQLMLGGDLPRAVADREFTVLFQPIVDLATGQMIAAEALARWHHPDRGDLDPRRFLAAVERSGLLAAFAEAVLDQSLAAMSRWRAEGIDAAVAVNASPRSLLDPCFPQLVEERLGAHGVPGRDLVVELTESLTLGQVEMVGGVLRQLRATGVRLALDDFGTGYSSLAMLAKVPVHELKIDRSFVSAMENSPEAAAVVRSTIELGRSLELLVVAEGVEEDAQRRALATLGCAAGQGHLFARPVTADALIELIRAGVDGVPGRLCAPVHAAATNVIDLPRARRDGSVESERHCGEV